MVRVRNDSFSAAWATCTYVSETEWRLNNIETFSKARKAHLWWHNVSFLNPKPIDCRKWGIGTELLKIIIKEARRYDIKLLHGSVTNGDLKNNPHLLEWYQKHGFELREPTHEAFLVAFKRIECNPSIILGSSSDSL